jgi:hypothetical protein
MLRQLKHALRLSCAVALLLGCASHSLRPAMPPMVAIPEDVPDREDLAPLMAAMFQPNHPYTFDASTTERLGSSLQAICDLSGAEVQRVRE